MENHIQNIELINDYLNKRLSESDIQDFESRLKSEELFSKEFEEHVVFLEGLKRQQLRKDIAKAKQSYIKNIWFKYLGFFIGLIALCTVIYLNFINAKTENLNPTKSEISNSVRVSDSVVKNDTIKGVVFKDTAKTEQPKAKEAAVKKETIIKKEIAEIKIPKKQTQIFTINTTKDTTIVCKEGTKLTIKANSFVDKNNEIVIGEINLKVTEYYQLSDILLANLSTQSNGKLLETGGMLNLQAYSGNELLNLRQNFTIEIIFPTKKKNMKLFTGEWNNGVINWNFASAEEEIEPIIREIVVEKKEEINVPFSVIEQVPIYPGCEVGNNTQRKDCMREAISKFVQRNFNTQITDDIGLAGRQRINVTFRIDKNGDIVDVRSRAPEPELEMEAIRVISLLPKMLPGKQRDKAVNVPYSLPIIFEANGIPSVGRSPISRKIRDSINNKKFEARLTQKDSSQVTASEVSSYILRTSKLGWINCDRFTNSRNKINYKLKIEDARGVIRISMVFKSMNSVLPSRRSGKEFDFKEVPKNEDIILIAIKKDKGKLYLDIINAKTEGNPNIDFSFKQVDLEELKSELKKLNKLF